MQGIIGKSCTKSPVVNVKVYETLVGLLLFKIQEFCGTMSDLSYLSSKIFVLLYEFEFQNKTIRFIRCNIGKSTIFIFQFYLPL